MPSRDAYLTGRLGNYAVPTVAHVDQALKALGIYLGTTLTWRQRTNAWADVDRLLDRRRDLSERVPA